MTTTPIKRLFAFPGWSCDVVYEMAKMQDVLTVHGA